MMLLKTYPPTFYNYTNTAYYNYKTEEIEGKLTTTVDAPGKDKEDIKITYEGTNDTYLIEIEGAQPLTVYLPRKVNTDKITAKLKKGVLTIEAPILNTDKTIQIT